MPTPWFRFYSETLSDRKIERVCRTTGQPKALILGAWATLLSFANESPIRGALLLTEDIPWTAADLAAETGLNDEALNAILVEFERMKMIVINDGIYHITNWDKRQFASDNSTKRVRRHRERQRNDAEEENDSDSNDDETLQERYSNDTVTHSDSDTESESDTDSRVNPDVITSELTPASWQSRQMFAKLTANAKLKGRRGPKRFPTYECRQKFKDAAEILGNQFGEALDKALEQGITSVVGVTNYVAKWAQNLQARAPPGHMQITR